MKVKVPHMKIVNDEKRKKKIIRKVEKSGRHTSVVREKLRIKGEGCWRGKIMVSCNFQN